MKFKKMFPGFKEQTDDNIIVQRSIPFNNTVLSLCVRLVYTIVVVICRWLMSSLVTFYSLTQFFYYIYILSESAGQIIDQHLVSKSDGGKGGGDRKQIATTGT